MSTENQAPTPPGTGSAPKPPLPIAKWVAGVTAVSSAAATIYGLYADKRIAILAFLGMVFGIVLLALVARAADAIAKGVHSLFWDILIKILVCFIMVYFMVLASVLFMPLYKWLTHDAGAANAAIPDSRVHAAIEGWGNGTATIRKIWWEEAEKYRTRLAGFLNVPIGEIQTAVEKNLPAAEKAHQIIFEDYENRIHPLLAEQKPTADPLVVNPILRERLGDMMIPDGPDRQKSLKQILDEGFPMTTNYFHMFFKTAANGRDPTTDPEVRRIYDTYLNRRQAVFGALQRNLP